MSPDELAQRRQDLEGLIAKMAPAVQADGGDLVLVDVDYEEGIVSVQLEGACGSCAISASTLQGGVERLLKERLDWVREVIGTVEDTLGFAEGLSIGRGSYVPLAPSER
jgi:Fe-S cluster biogenesis protein NfuA